MLSAVCVFSPIQNREREREHPLDKCVIFKPTAYLSHYSDYPPRDRERSLPISPSFPDRYRSPLHFDSDRHSSGRASRTETPCPIINPGGLIYYCCCRWERLTNGETSKMKSPPGPRAKPLLGPLYGTYVAEGLPRYFRGRVLGGVVCGLVRRHFDQLGRFSLRVCVPLLSLKRAYHKKRITQSPPTSSNSRRGQTDVEVCTKEAHTIRLVGNQPAQINSVQPRDERECGPASAGGSHFLPPKTKKPSVFGGYSR